MYVGSAAVGPARREYGVDSAALREKYRIERDKRLRPDGNDQYLEPTGRFADLLDDPYTPVVDREPVRGDVTVAVIGALYKVMGGALLALGVLLGLVTLFGVMENLLWAKLANLAGSLIAGGFAALAPREVERLTGVRTPWRPAAALTALAILAFVLTLV